MIRPDSLLTFARNVHEKQIAWRRHLHKHPELSDREFETTSFITKLVKSMGCRIIPIKMPTGVLAELRGKGKGPTIAIRTDIDALPILEQTNLTFKSCRPGVMHACGHDVHMGTVLGAVAVLSGLREQFSGSVRFIFQPSEENAPGGARPMIANGALDGVATILGLHVDPNVRVGRIGLRDGITMAAVYDFDLVVKGVSGHAARPHEAVDAIATAAEIIDSMQKVVSREIDPIDPVVITFGKISGGTARNVVADEVRLVGTARSLSASAARKLPAAIKRTAEGICRARGASCKIGSVAGYPILKNHAATNSLYRLCYDSLFGTGKIDLTEPVLGGEDFACYLEKVPGAMFRLGIQNKKLKADQPWHSPKFMVDEKALYYGTSLLAMATVSYLDGDRI
ncbi:MAG: M20 family metallopeptidase [Candidatus Zixiibacteriota bacterium]